jgi:hypothetical protein
MTDPEPAPERQALRHTIASVAASFFGVQSSKNRERDFKHGRASHFIAVGLVATVVFILLVVLAVRFALRQAGA